MGKPSHKAQTNKDQSTNVNEDIKGVIAPVTDIMETDKPHPTSASGFGECKDYYKNHQELKLMYNDRG
jgi:predicted alpha/beta-fold hydrolase